MNQKLTTLTIRTQTFEVFVDTEGEFFVQLDHTTVKEQTLAGLREKLLKVTKQKAQVLAVPFEEIKDDGKTRAGTVTGVHTNGNLMVKWPGVKGSEQFSRYSFGRHDYTRPMTPEERAEWAAICRLRDELEKRREKFYETCCINLRDAVRTEMARLTGEQGGIEL